MFLILLNFFSHCYFVGNCIGARNLKNFYIMVLCSTILISIGLVLTGLSGYQSFKKYGFAEYSISTIGKYLWYFTFVMLALTFCAAVGMCFSRTMTSLFSIFLVAALLFLVPYTLMFSPVPILEMTSPLIVLAIIGLPFWSLTLSYTAQYTFLILRQVFCSFSLFFLILSRKLSRRWTLWRRRMGIDL